MIKSISERNKKAWKRGGYETIISRLLTNQYFNEPNNTPVRSIYKADFAEVVRVLSIENAS